MAVSNGKRETGLTYKASADDQEEPNSQKDQNDEEASKLGVLHFGFHVAYEGPQQHEDRRMNQEAEE